jgi:glyoxylase-like metal-dependent hydrolase (beta-lactamase superfamily II)
MEDSLDKISKGTHVWHELCSECNLQVDNLINSLSDKGLDAKLEIKIDDSNTYLVGKYGPVIKHIEETEEGKEIVSFKPIRSDIHIEMDRLKRGDYSIEEIVDSNKDINNGNKTDDSISSIILGNCKLQVLFTPGHAPGHVAFYEEREGIIIVGDTLFFESIGRTDLPGGNYETLVSSIHKVLFSLPAAVIVYPGHGPKTSIGYEKMNNPYVSLS